MCTFAVLGYMGDKGAFFSVALQENPLEIGSVLVKHYDTEEKAIELIKKGASVLIAPKLNPDPAIPHSGENPQDDVCIFVHRDLHIDECKVYDGTELTEMLESVDEYYHYIFQDDKWYVGTYKNGKKSTYKPFRRARLLITSSKGYPIAKISNIPMTYRIHTNRKADVRIAPDDTESLMVSIDYWYDFLSLNKDHFGLRTIDDVEIDKASIQYYGFADIGGNQTFRANLTEKFVQRFFEMGASALIRYEPNTKGSTNFLGMKIPEFESVIVDIENSLKVGADATVEECETMMKFLHPNSTACRALAAHVEAISMTDEEREMTLEDVQAFERELQYVINEYVNEIEEFKKTLPPSPAFDCGFAVVKPKSTDLMAKYQKLVSLGIRDDTTVDVSFPYDYQSASYSHSILDKLIELSNADILHDVYIKIIWD